MAIKLLFVETTNSGEKDTIKECNIYDDGRLVLPRVGDITTFQFSGKGELVVTKIVYDYSIYSSRSVPEKITVCLKKLQANENQNT